MRGRHGLEEAPPGISCLFNLHNVRVSLDMKDKGLEFAFFIDNISNVAREQFQYDLTATTGSWIRAYAPPRWIGGSIRKSF